MTLVSLLGKKYSLEILAATDYPRTRADLSATLDIPEATCYRRIQELTEHGLLEANKSLNDNHRWEFFYRRTYDAVDIDFQESLSVHAKQRD